MFVLVKDFVEAGTEVRYYVESVDRNRTGSGSMRWTKVLSKAFRFASREIAEDTARLPNYSRYGPDNHMQGAIAMPTTSLLPEKARGLQTSGVTTINEIDALRARIAELEAAAVSEKTHLELERPASSQPLAGANRPAAEDPQLKEVVAPALSLPGEFEGLFDPDPRIRLEAARPFAPERAARVIFALKHGAGPGPKPAELDVTADLPETLRPSVARWGDSLPSLWGAVNAWVVFVGPSPSNFSTADILRNRLARSEEAGYPTLGWPHPSFYYSNSDRFIVAIRAWTREALAGINSSLSEEDALTNCLVVNLASAYVSDTSGLAAGELVRGAARFWMCIVPVARPRLVVALTRDVYSQLVRNRPQGAQIRSMPDVAFRDSSRSYELPRAQIRHQNLESPVLFATVPNHPSRYIPKGADYSQLYRYLAQTARDARGLT